MNVKCLLGMHNWSKPKKKGNQFKVVETRYCTGCDKVEEKVVA